MQVPRGSERFTFPNPQAANSPPATPESSSSFQASPPSYVSVPIQKRYGFYGPLLSPPENIAPIAGNKFSYTPPLRQSTDSDSSESEESDEVESSSDEDDLDIEFEAPEAPEVPPPPPYSEFPSTPLRRSSIGGRSFDSSSVDISVEDITENDITYDSDTSVLLPTQCEEVSSDYNPGTRASTPSDSDSGSDSDWDSDQNSDANSEQDGSLVNGISNLTCSTRASLLKKGAEFENARRATYERRKRRWLRGGNHKRSITESIGSASDTEDIVPLDDADVVGSSARRLRRRTEGPDARPRKSLLFDDPPNEIEELKYLDGAAEEAIDTDDEFMLPPWMYPNVPAMEVDGVDEDD